MKRHGPKVHFSTAAQHAASAPGYAASGESRYSRRVANPAERPVSLVDSPRSEPRPHVYLLHYQLVAKTDHELGKLQRRLAIVTDPAQREKLERNLEIKTRFLRRLLAERMRGTTVPYNPCRLQRAGAADRWRD